MRIVVHGQQAFGKAVLEALLKRGENIVGVYVAPERPGQRPDPLKEAAQAANLPVHQPASYRKPEVWERSEEHTSELQSRPHLVCRLLLEKKKKKKKKYKVQKKKKKKKQKKKH